MNLGRICRHSDDSFPHVDSDVSYTVKIGEANNEICGFFRCCSSEFVLCNPIGEINLLSEEQLLFCKAFLKRMRGFLTEDSSVFNVWAFESVKWFFEKLDTDSQAGSFLEPLCSQKTMLWSLSVLILPSLYLSCFHFFLSSLFFLFLFPLLFSFGIPPLFYVSWFREDHGCMLLLSLGRNSAWWVMPNFGLHPLVGANAVSGCCGSLSPPYTC